MPGTFDERVFAEWSEYHDRRFASFSRLVRSTFDEALDHFSDGAIDLLHIDGYHTFDAVSHDFESWRPKMSGRGVVLCHDINVREKEFGAWRLWDRVAQEYPSFAFRHGHGLGVLGIGRDLPEPLQWLFGTDADEANTVRMFFTRLGASVTAQHAAVGAARSGVDGCASGRSAWRSNRSLPNSPYAMTQVQQATNELDALRTEAAMRCRCRRGRRYAPCAQRSAQIDMLTAENSELKASLANAQQAPWPLAWWKSRRSRHVSKHARRGARIRQWSWCPTSAAGSRGPATNTGCTGCCSGTGAKVIA